MSYQFTAKCQGQDAAAIWKFIQNGLATDVTIRSIRDKVQYNVNYVREDAISFSAPSRNGGEAEMITRTDFDSVIPMLKAMKAFNTDSARKCFKGTRIYRKRSPFFALLVSCGAIEKMN